MRSLLEELRIAAKTLARAPAFAALALLILATGIGASTLMFGLVHTAVVRTLPFEDPDRVVWMYNLRTERDRAPLSAPDVEDYRREARSLSGLATFTNWSANLTGHGPPERLEGTRVSGCFFRLLGLKALVGRPLQPDDEERDARVVVLTHGLWKRRFGGDTTIVGRPLILNGTSYTIVGVLPSAFMFPFREAELAVPLSVRSDPRRADRGANFLRVVARLAPGVTVTRAKAELDAMARRLQRLYPTENARKTGVSLYPLHAEIVRDYRAILWTLLAAVGILLAIGCGNLANLLLVRNADRRAELAVRLALGASRGRLIRQLVSEAAILAIAAGIAGIGLASLGLMAWRAWGPASFPRMDEVGLNAHAVVFAVAVSGATTLACTALPAWFISYDTASALRGAARAMTAGRRQAALRRAFVGAQMAAAAVLLVGMGLAVRGFARLEHVSPGFARDRTLTLQLSLPPRGYASRDALVRYSKSLEDRLDAMVGVETAGMVSLLPLSGLLSTMDVAFPDRPAPPPDEMPQAHFRIASPGYFAAGGIPVLEGRAFTRHDRADSQPVAIVSRTFATRHWPGERAIGKSVRLVQPGAPALEVVGVVSDVKHFTLDAPSTADLYVPLEQMPPSQAPLLAARTFWVVRGRVEPSRLARDVREAVLALDPGVASSGARTLEDVVSASLAPRRMNVRLLEVFGQAALILCAVGVYGVAAFSARTRRRELAIRAALGARRHDLTKLMLCSELWPAAIGIAIGLSAAFLAAPSLFGSAFGTNVQDVPTYVAVGSLLLAVAALTSYAPARRGGNANPTELLHIS